MHAANYGVFGVRKLHVVLNREPDLHGRGRVARCTVERLMRDLQLHGIRRAKAPNTTRSAPREQCPADLVDRHFWAFGPNELWVADITYVRTMTGWVYVAFVTDVFNREIVGWQVATSLHTDLALDALNMAIYQRKREGDDLTGLVHHSDRGVQYRAIRYGQALAAQDAVASVGSKGDSYDNALAEALNSLGVPPAALPWGSQGRTDPEQGTVARDRRHRVRDRGMGPLAGHVPTPLRDRQRHPARLPDRASRRPRRLVRPCP